MALESVSSGVTCEARLVYLSIPPACIELHVCDSDSRSLARGIHAVHVYASTVRSYKLYTCNSVRHLNVYLEV